MIANTRARTHTHTHTHRHTDTHTHKHTHTHTHAALTAAKGVDVLDRVCQAARRVHDGHGAVAQRVHLVEAARLKAVRVRVCVCARALVCACMYIFVWACAQLLEGVSDKMCFVCGWAGVCSW